MHEQEPFSLVWEKLEIPGQVTRAGAGTSAGAGDQGPSPPESLDFGLKGKRSSM